MLAADILISSTLSLHGGDTSPPGPKAATKWQESEISEVSEGLFAPKAR